MSFPESLYMGYINPWSGGEIHWSPLTPCTWTHTQHTIPLFSVYSLLTIKNSEVSVLSNPVSIKPSWRQMRWYLILDHMWFRHAHTQETP